MAVTLEPREIDEFMNARPTTILCVTRPGKAPFATPMWFAWMDGQVFMHTLLTSKKVQYVREQPLVTCVVEAGLGYYELKSVLLMGHCDVIDDQEVVRAEMERMRLAKPLYEELRPKELPPHLEKHYAKPRALFRLKPHSITTWDFAKIRV